MYSPINWTRIAEALSYYPQFGYSYIEAPWIVSDDALKVTLPPDRTGLKTQDGALVGSAEQSFIQLAMDNALRRGRYIAATPCFRDDEEDHYHQRYFFKVELIQVEYEPIEEPTKAVWRMAEEAYRFFVSKLPSLYKHSATILTTPQGLDIEVNGIEVGSYGYRSHGDFHWIYGTGLAEPRYSLAVEP